MTLARAKSEAETVLTVSALTIGRWFRPASWRSLI